MKELIARRDKLKKTAIKGKSSALMDSYKKVRNQVTSINTALKKQYYSNKIQASNGNIKETWSTLNQFLNKRSRSTNIDMIQEPGRNILNKQSIFETMNDFFCSIGRNLADKIENSPNPLLSGDYEVNPLNRKFKFNSVSIQDISKEIYKLKKSKSFGDDGISTFFIKSAMPYIENSLVYLFNTSIESGIFPDRWKIARITPIFKSGVKTDKSNYRPKSVLPVVSRLLEKLIFNQLNDFLNKNDLIAQSQSGFRALHSTATTFLKCTDDWYNALDTGQNVGLVFLDLRKAFDTVDHDILCKKLMHYGIRDRDLSWFTSYLSNRRQYCRVDGIDSKISKIDIGLPQGSCLRPLLFLIYINDLPLSVPVSTTHMFADDTSLCHMSKNNSQLNDQINGDLKFLNSWLKGNKLSLNVQKTNSMLICTKPKCKTLIDSNLKLDLTIEGNELEGVPCIKYLEVQIVHNLNWKEHIKTISLKISRAIGFKKYAKKFLPSAILQLLYNSIIEPHIRYCCSVWGSCGVTTINQLHKLQNRVARIITNSDYNSPSRAIIERLGWSTVEELINSESSRMVYKSLNNLAPQYLRDIFEKNSLISSFNLRNTNTDLRIPMKHTAMGQKAFSYRGAKLWNNLPIETKRASSMSVFKKCHK